MEKNWLLRTQNKQILGPISRAKLIELVEKGSLSPEDEVCVGCGFWFYVKEKDNIQKYLYDAVVPDFNPISEAPSVLTGDGESVSDVESDSQTAVLNLNDLQGQLSQKPTEDGEQSLPDDGDLDYPDMGDATDSVAEKKK